LKEVVMADEVYTKLREFLDAMPGGFPATDAGVEMKILEKLFTPEDAKMVLRMTSEAETAEAIAGRCGLEKSEAEERLESMAGRGLVFRIKQEGEVLYRAEQFVVGIYEYQYLTMDRELAELVEDYMLYLGMPMLSNETKQFRVIPIASAVETAPAVASYDMVRDLVRQQQTISLGECICRKQQSLLGNECSRPFEGCMGFGDLGQFFIDRGLGRSIGVEEALQVLSRSEEAGLVLQPNNTQKADFICSCCSCCCGILKSLKLFPNVAEFIESSYQAQKDMDKCTACETCLERCPMDAIVKDEENIKVDLARCIGCGVCIPTCPEKAISLVPKEGAMVPPMDLEEMQRRILVERGLA
jgi:Na+-translocating ferredoxin:NAD+ oxidoreductase subunit B